MQFNQYPELTTLSDSDLLLLQEATTLALRSVKLSTLKEFIGISTPTSKYGKYAQEVLKDVPYAYLQLNDLSGSTAIDISQNEYDCQYQGSVTYQQESSLVSDPENKSVKFDGNTRIVINPAGASPTSFSLECRFKTTNANGGLFGFDNGNSYDKDVYLENGRIKFLNYNGATIITPNTYNDSQWHTVLATVGSRGAEIWIDGELTVSNSNTNTQQYNANWYIGWGKYGNYFNGLIDEPSITYKQLSAVRIKARHLAAIS